MTPTLTKVGVFANTRVSLPVQEFPCGITGRSGIDSPEGKVEQVITSEGVNTRARLEQVPAQPAGGYLVETKPINAKMKAQLAKLLTAVKDLKARMKGMERELK